MKITLRWLAALLALSFAAAACGSGDGEATSTGGETGQETSAESETDADAESDGADEDADGDAAMAEEAVADEDADSDAAMADEDDAMAEEAVADAEQMDEGDDAMTDDGIDAEEEMENLLGEVTFISLFWPEGTEPSDEVLSCIDSKGVDPNISPFAGTEDELTKASVAITGCAPDDMAEMLSADVLPPEGTTVDDVKCVMRETFGYMGSVPIDEAVALAGTGDTIPPELRALVIGPAQDACNLSAEQVDAIFEA